MATYTITHLATELGVTLRTLRFYEGRGVVSPTRKGSERVYSEADRELLRQAVDLKKLGFTVAEIAAGGIDHDKYAAQLAAARVQRSELDAAIAALELLVARSAERAPAPRCAATADMFGDAARCRSVA